MAGGEAENRQIGCENQDKLLDQSFLRAGHEGRQPICERFQAEDYRIVEHRLDGLARFSAKDRFGSLPEEQFISMNAPVDMEDWLARKIPQLAS